MASMRLQLFLVVCIAGIHLISSVTDPNDAAVLQSLKDSLQIMLPSWNTSNDPCGSQWEGVTCNNSRVIALGLSGFGLQGELTSKIGGLTELISLRLEYNINLTGSLPSTLGDLKKLHMLILNYCSFTGEIPSELGNLSELTFLDLSSNNLTGAIPPSLGKLSNLTWLALEDNQLTGPIPVSTSTTPGLDLLLKAEHLFLRKNQLSGSIPLKLFSSEMSVTDLLLDRNMFTGSIPATLGLVQTLEVICLYGNALTGPVPSNLNNLTNVDVLRLENNNLKGPLPDLSGMNALNYIDLSNNSFDPSEAPLWFSTLPSLTGLVLEFGALQGAVPEKMFSNPALQQVKLKYNAFNGTFNMGDGISQQLQLVDLQSNQISKLTVGEEYKKTLILAGNPVCNGSSASTYCQPPHQATKS